MRYDKVNSEWENGLTFLNGLPASKAKDRLLESWLEWKGEIDTKLPDRKFANAAALMQSKEKISAEEQPPE